LSLFAPSEVLNCLDQDRLPFDFGAVGFDRGARGTGDALAVGSKSGSVAGADESLVLGVPLQGAAPVTTGRLDRGYGFALGDHDHRLGSGDRRGGDLDHAILGQGGDGADDRESILAGGDGGSCGGFGSRFCGRRRGFGTGFGGGRVRTGGEDDRQRAGQATHTDPSQKVASLHRNLKKWVWTN
jgi:hypothetical protein